MTAFVLLGEKIGCWQSGHCLLVAEGSSSSWGFDIKPLFLFYTPPATAIYPPVVYESSEVPLCCSDKFLIDFFSKYFFKLLCSTEIFEFKSMPPYF